MNRIAPLAALSSASSALAALASTSSVLAALATVVACSSADSGGADAPDAATAGDASGSPDATGACTATPREAIEISCDGVDNDCDGTVDNVANPPPWYIDGDGDGHGGGSATRFGCEQPAGHVASADDCNDSDAAVHPGARESCDGVDNDCSAGTAETCNNGCQPRVNVATGKRYLFCTTSQNWDSARTLCMAEGFDLAIVGDEAENAFLDSTGGSIQGGSWWIGAGDRITEDQWLWVDGTPFWQGRSNGQPIEGRYRTWAGNEPNNDGDEDCGELRDDGNWNDNKCTASIRFICER
jgi:hypothetical protein